MTDDFAPIKRETCEGCGRPVESYYDDRKQHMASAFRSGIPVNQIARAYYISPEWAMKLITEQMGKEAVLEVHETYWKDEDK